MERLISVLFICALFTGCFHSADSNDTDTGVSCEVSNPNGYKVFKLNGENSDATLSHNTTYIAIECGSNNNVSIADNQVLSKLIINGSNTNVTIGYTVSIDECTVNGSNVTVEHPTNETPPCIASKTATNFDIRDY